MRTEIGEYLPKKLEVDASIEIWRHLSWFGREFS